jgi:hypothetical protein
MALISVDEAQAMVSAGGHFSPWIADLGLRIERIACAFGVYLLV